MSNTVDNLEWAMRTQELTDKGIPFSVAEPLAYNQLISEGLQRRWTEQRKRQEIEDMYKASPTLKMIETVDENPEQDPPPNKDGYFYNGEDGMGHE